MAKNNEDKLFCLCGIVKLGKPPKKYGIPTKRAYDGKSCTCVSVVKGKSGKPYYGDIKVLGVK